MHYTVLTGPANQNRPAGRRTAPQTELQNLDLTSSAVQSRVSSPGPALSPGSSSRAHDEALSCPLLGTAAARGGSSWAFGPLFLGRDRVHPLGLCGREGAECSEMLV